jgi:hypothetical protein
MNSETAKIGAKTELTAIVIELTINRENYERRKQILIFQ